MSVTETKTDLLTIQNMIEEYGSKELRRELCDMVVNHISVQTGAGCATKQTARAVSILSEIIKLMD